MKIKELIIEFFHTFWFIIKLPFILIGLFFVRVYHLGLRRILMLWVALFMVIGLFMFASLKATSSSGFCKSCHIMRPFIEAWENSSHADVECMKCHAREGLDGYLETKFTAVSMLANYATGIYKRSRPWAEIDDSNCLQGGCHETRLLDGMIEFTKGINFDHAPHLSDNRRGRKLRCTSCHSQMVQGEHISVTTTTCFLCHFKNTAEAGREELSECIKCHIPPSGVMSTEGDVFDHSDVIERSINCNSCHQFMSQGSGQVRREKCGSCHSEVDKINKIIDLDFIHEWHIEKRKVECLQCHDPIEHRHPSIDKDIRSNCANCHEDQHSFRSKFLQGTGAKLIKRSMPEIMFESGVVCISCHKDSNTGHGSSQISQDACTPCHSQSFKRLADLWRKGFETRIKRIERALPNAHAHPQLEDAILDLEFIKEGGPWHNPQYAEALLTEISNVLNEAGVKAAQPAHYPAGSKECLKCHSSIAEVPVILPTTSFDHRSHLSSRKITCQSCHDGADPGGIKHGSLKQASADCVKCHHKPETSNGNSCEPCHIPSRSLYFGRLPGIDGEPSPMAEAEMTCTDCHEGTQLRPPGSEFCLDCHEADTVTEMELLYKKFDETVKENGKLWNDAQRLVVADEGRAVHHPELAGKILQ